MLWALNDTLPIKQSPKLLDEVRAVLRTKHYRIRIEEAYTQWIKHFIITINSRFPCMRCDF